MRQSIRANRHFESRAPIRQSNASAARTSDYHPDNGACSEAKYQIQPDIFFRKGIEGRILFRTGPDGKIDALIDRRNNEDIIWMKNTSS